METIPNPTSGINLIHDDDTGLVVPGVVEHLWSAWLTHLKSYIERSA